MSPYAEKPAKPTQEEAESRLSDLHYAIFERLPDEGRLLGFSPLAISTKHLAELLNAALPAGAPRIRPGKLGAELRNLSTFGLALNVRSLAGSIIGWQRTARAAELLAIRKREMESRAEEKFPTTNVSSIFPGEGQ